MWMRRGERDSKKKELRGAGKRKKQAQGDAHSSSRGERRSKQRFSPGRVPAEPRRSASAHNVKYNEGRGGGGVNDDADENDEDKDDDGRLVFPINTSALE